MSEEMVWPPLSSYPDEFWTRLGVPELREQSIAQLRGGEGLTYSTVEQLARHSGVKMPELARLLNISVSTLRRRRLRGHFKPGESYCLLGIFAVIGNAIDLFEGNTSSAVDWLREPQRGLHGHRPLAVAASPGGHETVLNLIGQLEHGVLP
ncbi:type II RES/Xre toxin-antitoxin system antitoxin [Metapseudomonas furukawaii]